VLLAIALTCVWAGGLAFVALVAFACVLLVIEWWGICCRADGLPAAAFLMMALVLGSAVCGAADRPALGLLIVLAGTVGFAVWGERAISLPSGAFSADARTAHPAVPNLAVPELATPDLATPELATPHAAPSDPARIRRDLALGVPYLGLAAVAVPWLRADPAAGLANTIFVLSIVWSSDIGAYMIGRLAGGPKLVPSISPGKTWSGAIGGLVCAALAGLAVAACFSSGFSSPHVLTLAIVLGIVSQAGDLLESALKRHFGVKDSGRMIPGHGGLLDRLDALLAVAPVAALLAFTAGRGVVLWR
jgi:phosphatidate cytidylyltransferase